MENHRRDQIKAELNAEIGNVGEGDRTIGEDSRDVLLTRRRSPSKAARRSEEGVLGRAGERRAWPRVTVVRAPGRASALEAAGEGGRERRRRRHGDGGRRSQGRPW